MQILELKNYYESWAYITIKNIGFELIRIMPKHVGKDSAITRESLIKRIFGIEASQLKPINYFVISKMLAQACHYVRTNTNCFLVSMNYGGTIHFYVMSNQEELEGYIKRGDNLVKGVRRMQVRARHAVQNKWHLQPWKAQNRLE